MQKINPADPKIEQNMLKEKLMALCPEIFIEGKINFDALQTLLPDDLEDEEATREHFGLNWTGKTQARRLALTRPRGSTLRPAIGEGINEEITQNVFIEGDNLEVLKILREAYSDQVKMIYIDPPYNTGHDFIYKDDFSETIDDYLNRTQQKDGSTLLVANPKASGRFHSNWLNFIYPRLRIARELLTEDGVIFVSIDDNEVHNLRQLMNEIYGEENLLSSFVWRTDGNFDNQAKVKNCHEYVLAYCKQIDKFSYPPVVDPSIESGSKLFNEEIRNTIVKNGPKNPKSIVTLPIGFPAKIKEGIILKRFDSYPYYHSDAVIKDYKLTNEVNIESGWGSRDIFDSYVKNLSPITDSKGQDTTFEITNLNGTIENVKTRTFKSHVISVLTKLGNTQSTSSDLEREGLSFDYPKPIQLIKYLIQMNQGNDIIVVDFFAGSGTTAQSVIEANIEDQGKRKFICVQLPEILKLGKI